MASKIDYIYRRGEVWWLKLQYPADVEKGGAPRVVRRSLKTTDRKEAEAKSLSKIYGFKQYVLLMRGFRKPDDPSIPRWKHPLGIRVDNVDGTYSSATEDQIFHYGQDGLVILIEPNRQLMPITLRLGNLPPKIDAEMKALKLRAFPELPGRDLDEEMIQFWIEVAAPSKSVLGDLRRTYAQFRELFPKTTFASATPDNAREFGRHLTKTGLKSRTVKKAVGQLGSIMNLAMTEPKKFPKITGNAFSRAVKLKDDMLDRVPFNDDEMALMRDNLHKLDPDEKLLWILCATTGMRRSEAWQIQGEQNFEGIRCVQIGRKNRASDRVIPIPAAAMPFLPAKITGCLFEDPNPINVGKNLLRFIRRMGIVDSEEGSSLDASQGLYKDGGCR